MRFGVIGALLVGLIGGTYVVWPRVSNYTVVGY